MKFDKHHSVIVDDKTVAWGLAWPGLSIKVKAKA